MSLRNRNQGDSTELITTGSSALDKKAGSLRKTANSAIKTPTGAGLSAVRKATLRNGLDSISSNIGFVFDATESRQHVWPQAIEAFQQMFHAISTRGEMQLRVMDFGFEGDVVDREWSSNVEEICEIVSNVECRGGCTQINDCLSRMVADGGAENPHSVIYVGDHYEETDEELEQTIKLMNANNVRVYTLLDSNCPNAERAYRHLAKSTGGEFARLNGETPFPDLCEGIALLTTGGKSALNRLQNLTVRNLLLGGPSQP